MASLPPVATKAYDLALWMLRTVPKFPRIYRPGLGGRIESLSLDILDRVVVASCSRDKSKHLREANLGLERLRHLVRMCRDLDIFSSRQYRFASEEIDEVGRMLGGWLKQQRRGGTARGEDIQRPFPADLHVREPGSGGPQGAEGQAAQTQHGELQPPAGD